jgi:hypothetical protein
MCAVANNAILSVCSSCSSAWSSRGVMVKVNHKCVIVCVCRVVYLLSVSVWCALASNAILSPV